MSEELLTQAGKALLYYGALILLMRLSGKRLAGQTTTFDLIVLITLGVVLQSNALQKGVANGLVFVATVFGAHKGLAWTCGRSARIRHWVRGAPRALVRDGVVMEQALRDESVSPAELQAGLRKLGFDSPEEVKLAVLEETGQISAIAKQ